MKYYLIDYSGPRIAVLSRSSATSEWVIEASFASGEAAEAYIEDLGTLSVQYRCEAA